MNFFVGDVLHARYDLLAVAASYIVSVMGSLAALYHTKNMFHRDGSINQPMAVGAAVALGGIGIWTTHFIGMIGYRLPTRVVYDGPFTLISLIVVITIAGVALLLAGGRGRFSKTGWLFGSLLAGLGICVMHYTGMYAMNLRANMSLEPITVLASILIAVTAAAAALWLAFHIDKNSHRIAAALTMGLAVCAMHYTGMASAEFVCVVSKELPAWYVGGKNLPVLVIFVAGLVLVALCWNILGLLQAPAKARHPSRLVQTNTPAFRDSRQMQ